MIRVRFHLARGPHYMQWQVRRPHGEVEYYDPDATSLTLLGCVLVVQPGTAARVHRTGVKSVCGWVQCMAVEAVPPVEAAGGRLAFNPIKDVHWRLGDRVVDGDGFDRLVTIRRGIFLTN